MNYFIKYFNIPLIKFCMTVHKINGLVISDVEALEDNKWFPKDLTISNQGILNWISRRIIRKNRAYVQNILKELNIRGNDKKSIIDICFGLSLNDCYWIVPESFNGTFEEYNLYDNEITQKALLIQNKGILDKKWERRSNGDLYMYKKGGSDKSNSGVEVYNEFFASQIAKQMELNAVEYDLDEWDGDVSSVCKIFTSKKESYVSASKIIKGKNFIETIEFAKTLGKEAYDDLASIFVFDALICNEDRNSGNYGFIINNDNGQIDKVAPIFDNGISLFNYGNDEDFKDLITYANTRLNSNGSNHLDIAKYVMGEKQIDQLKKIRGFSIRQHSKFSYPEKRLRVLNIYLQQRINQLLSI